MRDRATFAALRRSRRRVRKGPVTLVFVPDVSAGCARVAYAINRAAGGAVVRNRLRRRLRSVMSELEGQLVPGAYLVGATAEAVPLSFGELKAIVSEALEAVVGQGPR